MECSQPHFTGAWSDPALPQNSREAGLSGHMAGAQYHTLPFGTQGANALRQALPASPLANCARPKMDELLWLPPLPQVENLDFAIPVVTMLSKDANLLS